MKKTFCDICGDEVGSNAYLITMTGPGSVTESHEVCRVDYKAVSDFIFERRFGKTREEMFGKFPDDLEEE